MRRIYFDRRRLRHPDIVESSVDIASTATPLTDYERGERAEMVREQIARLPERQRELITLRDICDLSYDEISAQTGMTVTNIRTAISRARKTLKEKLSEKLK
jgi:RNA polymerase sigma-70 factor (ECF subfamily)